MLNVPNTENSPAFTDVMLEVKRLSSGIPESDHWRWFVFDKDLTSGDR